MRHATNSTVEGKHKREKKLDWLFSQNNERKQVFFFRKAKLLLDFQLYSQRGKTVKSDNNAVEVDSILSFDFLKLQNRKIGFIVVCIK